MNPILLIGLSISGIVMLLSIVIILFSTSALRRDSASIIGFIAFLATIFMGIAASAQWDKQHSTSTFPQQVQVENK